MQPLDDFYAVASDLGLRFALVHPSSLCPFILCHVQMAQSLAQGEPCIRVGHAWS